MAILILMSVAFMLGTQSEWVELPKLNPWSNEREQGTIEYVPLYNEHHSDNPVTQRTMSTEGPQQRDESKMKKDELNSSEHQLQIPNGNDQRLKPSVKIKPSETSPWNRTKLWINTIQAISSSRPPSLSPSVPIEFEQKTNSVPFNSTNHTNLDPFMKSLILQVHRTLLQSAGQPIKQKMHYLQGLQNKILNQIWQRSQRLWVVDGQNEGRGNDALSFPSLEGALLTISFLTFAVFLIKIVKQFIQGSQGTNGTMIEVPVTLTKVRHKRHALNVQALDILKMIDDFHLQHAHHH